jgi:hypothetical protein
MAQAVGRYVGRPGLPWPVILADELLADLTGGWSSISTKPVPGGRVFVLAGIAET